ncbi:MAG: thioredoxin [Candidatus Kapabacteria bacterium]|nr:thioredoxin [Candidatus Kapabacteria bacterium]
MENIKNKTFSELVKSDELLLVDFSAEWCGPCKMMPPILKELKNIVGAKVNIIKIDVDQNPKSAAQFQIRSVPTLMLFKSGNILWRQSGVVQANELESIINKQK